MHLCHVVRGQQHRIVARGIQLPVGAVDDTRPRQLRAAFGLEVGDNELVTLGRGRLGEGKEGFKQIIRSCGLPQAIQLGAKAIGWTDKRRRYGTRDPTFDGSETIDLAMHRTKAQRRTARAADRSMIERY